jgi:hypothetical protein
MSIRSNFPTITPALKFDFIDRQRLDPRITFTRTSTASYVSSNGIIQIAAANTPRFDYDPVALSSRGLFMESSITNTVINSNFLTVTTNWSTSNSFITANTTISPDGTGNCFHLYEDSTIAQHNLNQPQTYVAGTTYTFSLFCKAAERGNIQLRLTSAGNTWGTGNEPTTTVNLASGTFITGSGNSLASAVSTVTYYGNGWYRAAISANCVTSNTTGIGILLCNNSTGTISYQGDGVSGAYIYGAQVEASHYPTSYIVTKSSQVTRSTETASIANTFLSNVLNPNTSSITVYAEGMKSANVVNGYDSLFNIYNTSNTSNSIGVFCQPAIIPFRYYYSGFGGNGSPSYPYSLYYNTPFVTIKTACSFVGNNYILAFDGSATSNSTWSSSPIPVYSFNYLNIAPSFNGWIRKLFIYSPSLSGIQLAALTQVPYTAALSANA